MWEYVLFDNDSLIFWGFLNEKFKLLSELFSIYLSAGYSFVES